MKSFFPIVIASLSMWVFIGYAFGGLSFNSAMGLFGTLGFFLLCYIIATRN